MAGFRQDREAILRARGKGPGKRDNEGYLECGCRCLASGGSGGGALRSTRPSKDLRWGVVARMSSDGQAQRLGWHRLTRQAPSGAAWPAQGKYRAELKNRIGRVGRGTPCKGYRALGRGCSERLGRSRQRALDIRACIKENAASMTGPASGSRQSTSVGASPKYSPAGVSILIRA